MPTRLLAVLGAMALTVAMTSCTGLSPDRVSPQTIESVTAKCLTDQDGAHPDLVTVVLQDSGEDVGGERWFVRDTYAHMDSWVTVLDGNPCEHLTTYRSFACDTRQRGGDLTPTQERTLDKALAELEQYSHRVFLQFTYKPFSDDAVRRTVFANMDGETCEIGDRDWVFSLGDWSDHD